MSDSEYHAAMGEFAGHMLCTAIAAHFMHWSTSSYAAHKAVGEYYEAIPGLVDGVLGVLVQEDVSQYVANCFFVFYQKYARHGVLGS